MADPVPTPTTDQTAPLDAGHTTTEHMLTKWITVLATVIAVLSTISDVVLQASAVLPQGSAILRWVTLGAAVIGALTAIAYTISRTLVKMRALASGAPAETVVPITTDPAKANEVLAGGK